MAPGGAGFNNLRAMADAEEPEFGIRLFGYSRREVDEFVAELRRELRVRAGGTGEVTVVGSSPVRESAAARVLRLAAEAAEQRTAESVEQAELVLLSARELADLMRQEADRLVAEARRRARELEEQVAQTLEREVTARVVELAQAHERLVGGLSEVRDALEEVLARDAGLGPVTAQSLVPKQRRAE